MVDGVSRHYKVIDVRDAREFEDHHIPGSIHVPLTDIKEWLGRLSDKERQHEYLFVCSRMQRSARAAYSAQEYGV